MSTPLSKIEAISIKVRDHLLAQRAQCIDEAGDCVYRRYDGAMCAVGVLISEELYDPVLEGQEAESSDVMAKVLASTGLEEESTLTQQALEWVLMNWQRYHDSSPAYGTEVSLQYKVFLSLHGQAHSPEKVHQCIMRQVEARYPHLSKEQQ